jgi:hypothetical protein
LSNKLIAAFVLQRLIIGLWNDKPAKIKRQDIPALENQKAKTKSDQMAAFRLLLLLFLSVGFLVVFLGVRSVSSTNSEHAGHQDSDQFFHDFLFLES